MKIELNDRVRSFFGVTNVDLEQIISTFEPKKLKKDEYFLKSGAYSNSIGFVQSGVLRKYLFVDDKEITNGIAMEGAFVVDFPSFWFRDPARLNFQAITDCELFIVSRADYDNFSREIKKWHEIEKSFILDYFIKEQTRMASYLAMSAEQRYAQLLQSSPDLILQVPLQYLASMLGMSAETLSRVRRKLIKKVS